MSETTAIVSHPEVTQDYKIDIGEISIAASIGLVATFLFILAITGKLFTFRTKRGDTVMEMSTAKKYPEVERRQIDERELEIDEAIDVLIDRKYQVERRIMSAQIRTIRDHVETFYEFFPSTEALVVDSLWNRFAWELYNAAVENHILSQIKDGRINSVYLDDKMLPVHQGHRRLTTQYQIRSWDEVEIGLTLLMRTALDDFVEVARKEWLDFNESVKALRSFIGPDHPLLERRVKRLLENAYTGEE